VAPFPPPYGGIARWTQIITQHARRTGAVDLRLVDTAPRWREIHDLRPWRRWLFGSFHGIGLLARVAWNLACGCRALHITTSGQLAIHRDIAMMRLARFLGVPVIYHLRFGRIPELAESGAREWRLLAKALRLATVVVPIDRHTETVLAAHLPGLDLRLIPNCADVAALPSPGALTPAGGTVLFLGWVIPAKGIHELLQAWERLDVPGWRLIIAGPYESAFHQELTRSYPLARVEFTGPMNHAESMTLMAKSDIFLLPSHTEGFPNVIAEAMALGRPILATSVGAIPEMLEGGCGRIVPPQDAHALCAALRDLIGNEKLRLSLGMAAQAKLQRHYTLDAVFSQLLALWGEQTQ
jgi:glycosyltransferase involved in cell wall biosynthesis